VKFIIWSSSACFTDLFIGDYTCPYVRVSDQLLHSMSHVRLGVVEDLETAQWKTSIGEERTEERLHLGYEV